MPKFVKLPSGMIIDVDAVLFTARSELNKYHAFMRVPTPAMPNLDSVDHDALAAAMGIELQPEVKLAA